MGRLEEPSQLTKLNLKIVHERCGDNDLWSPKCQLVLSSLSLAGSVSGSSSSVSSADLWIQARDWALARDAKEVLCWSCLVEAQHALAEIRRVCARTHHDATETVRASTAPYENARTALESGLKIARDCGFGLFHIDLLLERARLHLLRGDAPAALDDIETALGDENGGGGIPADEETGQPELLAARHPACGYAWPIPAALQLRAEALLLQSAQRLGSNEWVAGVEERGTSDEPPVDAAFNKSGGSLRSTPATPDSDVSDTVEQAKQLLLDALELWQPLHDPEPERDDQNFKHPETGKEHNYRARETYRLLTDLEGGVLTSFPLKPAAEETSVSEVSTADKPVRVFFSYAHEDEKYKDELIKHLSILQRQSVIDVWHDRMIVAGDEWAGEIDDNLEQADVILLLVSADFLASDYCYDVEMTRALERHDAKEARVIPIILRTVDWNGSPFGKLQARPKDARPVDQWENQDEAFTDIAKGIRDAIENS